MSWAMGWTYPLPIGRPIASTPGAIDRFDVRYGSICDLSGTRFDVRKGHETGHESRSVNVAEVPKADLSAPRPSANAREKREVEPCSGRQCLRLFPEAFRSASGIPRRAQGFAYHVRCVPIGDWISLPSEEAPQLEPEREPFAAIMTVR